MHANAHTPGSPTAVVPLCTAEAWRGMVFCAGDLRVSRQKYKSYNQATLCDVLGAQPSSESTRSASHVSDIATSSWVSIA